MSDDTHSDEELMTRYGHGDSTAFDVLYRRHKGSLFRFLLRQCKRAAIAEELFQDVWMNLIKARMRYQASATFKTFLFTIAHNRLIDHYRRHSTQLAASFSEGANGDDGIDQIPAPETSDPQHRVDGERQLARLLLLLDELPEPQRQAFLLQEEAGLSLDEIATVTNVGAETAKSRIRYAMAKLRRGLSEP